MKIKEVITEEVDMSFWSEIDSHTNPEAHKYASKQGLRQSMLDKAFKGTAIFTKPYRQAENKFSTTPKSDQPISPGFAGNIDVQIRAGHISNEEGKKIVND